MGYRSDEGTLIWGRLRDRSPAAFIVARGGDAVQAGGDGERFSDGAPDPLVWRQQRSRVSMGKRSEQPGCGGFVYALAPVTTQTRCFATSV